MTDLQVRIATRAECLYELAEPRLLAALLLEPEQGLDNYLSNCDYSFYIIKFKEYRLLFYFYERDAGVYEIHLACPKQSIRASRVLSLGIISWMFKDSGLCPVALTTNCPEGKTANMLRKIGATEIKKTASLVYFMTTQDKL